MIAKIHSGQGFAGLVDYANDIRNKKADIIASEGVDLTCNKSITASFSLQAKSRPSLKNFVGHISLSFAPEDTPKLSDKLMADIAKEYLRRMGIVNRHFRRPELQEVGTDNTGTYTGIRPYFRQGEEEG